MDPLDSFSEMSVLFPDRMQKIRVVSEKYRYSREFSNFALKGKRIRELHCKCYRASTKTAVSEGKLLNVFEGIIIRK